MKPIVKKKRAKEIAIIMKILNIPSILLFSSLSNLSLDYAIFNYAYCIF